MSKKNTPRAVDPLRRLPPEMRAEAMRELFEEMFGEEVAARVWEQFGPALASTARQPGDHRDPQKNYWKGAWRIHEL